MEIFTIFSLLGNFNRAYKIAKIMDKADEAANERRVAKEEKEEKEEEERIRGIILSWKSKYGNRWFKCIKTRDCYFRGYRIFSKRAQLSEKGFYCPECGNFITSSESSKIFY